MISSDRPEPVSLPPHDAPALKQPYWRKARSHSSRAYGRVVCTASEAQQQIGRTGSGPNGGDLLAQRVEHAVQIACGSRNGTASREQLVAGLDAVMILAGGMMPDGSCPPPVQRRLDAAHSLQRLRLQSDTKQQQEQPQSSTSSSSSSPLPPPRSVGKPYAPPVVCLGGGTPHKPPILSAATGHVVHESTSCAAYLLDRGAQAAHLLKESSSYDTVGNAYFSLSIHALPAGWRNVAVVTSDFHMHRSRALFEDMYALAGAQFFGSPAHFNLLFVSVSDEGLFDADVLDVRRSKEAKAVADWKRTSAAFASLADVHAWLHATHLCYSVSRQHEFGVSNLAGMDPKLLASY